MRLVSEKLSRMVAAFPVTVVSGARQVGKTTLLRHHFPDFDYFVFDPVIDSENARKEPDLFLRTHPAPLILDEIQYAPELMAAVSGSRMKSPRFPGTCSEAQGSRSIPQDAVNRDDVPHPFPSPRLVNLGLLQDTLIPRHHEFTRTRQSRDHRIPIPGRHPCRILPPHARRG